MADIKESGENHEPEAEENPTPEPEETRTTEYFLYKSCMETLEIAALTYCVADLRELARKGKLSTDSETLAAILQESGGKAEAFSRVLNENKDALKTTFGEDYCELYLSALEDLKGHDSPESRILVFSDDNCHEELVYAISLDCVNKRITVSFRGSVTLKDWLVDADIFMKEIPNPLEPGLVHTRQRRRIRIHAGFYDYLLRVNKHTGESKMETIMKQVVAALEDNPGYHLWTTGHSLGAALSTLFAFHAAADPRIPKPVVSINFASPRVRNKIFRTAFQQLETEGQLLSLRVVNEKDVIPDMPGGQMKVGSCVRDDLIFRHVGMELNLHEDEKYSFIYSIDQGRRLQRVLKDGYTLVQDMLACVFLH